MSDVVSQLEAVIQGIEARTEHTKPCDQAHTVAVRGRVVDFDPRARTVVERYIDAACTCDRPGRVRAEIARTVERMINATVAVYMDSRYDEDAGWAAAFRATQEQENVK